MHEVELKNDQTYNGVSLEQKDDHMNADLEAKQSSFEKTRFDYCLMIWDQEAGRKQILETKAQLYLTFVTAFLTVIYFSLPFLGVLQGFMNTDKIDPIWRVTLTVLLIALGLAILFSLVAVMMAMRVQTYRPKYPTRPFQALFTPRSDQFEEESEVGLLHFIARTAIIAVEKNKACNDEKAKWVKGASYGILISVILLALLVGISVYLQVYVVATIAAGM